MTTTASLYRHWSGDTLLYVGITRVGQGRQAAHAGSSPWWPEVTSITIEHHETLAEARTAELAAIRSEAPLYNIEGAPPAQRKRAERLRYGDPADPLSPEAQSVLQRIVEESLEASRQRRDGRLITKP